MSFFDIFKPKDRSKSPQRPSGPSPAKPGVSQAMKPVQVNHVGQLNANLDMSSILAAQKRMESKPVKPSMQRSQSTPDMREAQELAMAALGLPPSLVGKGTLTKKSGVVPLSPNSGVIVPAIKPKEEDKQSLTYKLFKVGPKEAYDHPRRQLSTARRKLQNRLDSKPETRKEEKLKDLIKQKMEEREGTISDRIPKRSLSFDSYVPPTRLEFEEWEDLVSDDESIGSPVVVVPPGEIGNQASGATVMSPIRLPGVRGRRGDLPALDTIPIAGHHVHLDNPPPPLKNPLNSPHVSLTSMDSPQLSTFDDGLDLGYIPPPRAASPSGSPRLDAVQISIDASSLPPLSMTPPNVPSPGSLSPSLTQRVKMSDRVVTEEKFPNIHPYPNHHTFEKGSEEDANIRHHHRRLSDHPIVPYIAPGQGIMPRRVSVGKIPDTAVPPGMLPMPIQIGDPTRIEKYGAIPSRVSEVTDDEEEPRQLERSSTQDSEESRGRSPGRSPRSPRSPITFDFISDRRGSRSPSLGPQSPRSPLSPSPHSPRSPKISELSLGPSAKEPSPSDRLSTLQQEGEGSGGVKLVRDRSLRSKMLKSKTEKRARAKSASPVVRPAPVVAKPSITPSASATSHVMMMR